MIQWQRAQRLPALELAVLIRALPSLARFLASTMHQSGRKRTATLSVISSKRKWQLMGAWKHLQRKESQQYKVNWQHENS